MKILIADDSWIDRLALEQMFSKRDDFDCTFAENGKQAVDFFDDNFYDVILLDFEMPFLNGPETLDKMRANDASKVNRCVKLAITAHTDEQAFKLLEEKGFDNVVVKPFDKKQLFEKITSALKAREKNGQNNPVAESDKSTPRLYDLRMLKEYSDGDVGFQRDMLTYFIENSIQVIKLLKESLTEEDWHELMQQAHKYRSELGFLGFDSLSETCGNIEEMALIEEKRIYLPELIHRFSESVKEAVLQIRTDFKL